MRWKEFVREYFTFSYRDRLALLILAGLIGAVFWIPAWFPRKSPPVLTARDSAWVRESATNRGKEGGNEPAFEDRSSYYPADRPVRSPAKPPGELFFFDPNSISADGWARLGLREKTIRTILNYRNKGGRFRKPEDLSRIYGLFPDEYARLAPYIRIAVSTDSSVSRSEGSRPFSPAVPRYTVIDINRADTAGFIQLPGIGPALARRIIGFREKLGGFYSPDQVAETYGLPDSTFRLIRPFLKLEEVSLRKVLLNSATLDELKAHPYIRYQLARAITAYREQHGPFRSLEDLKQIALVSTEHWQKLVPYCSLE